MCNGPKILGTEFEFQSWKSAEKQSGKLGPVLLCLEWLCTIPLRFSCHCVYDSESTLKAQFDKEKAALQQSIHKNSAFISEKDQQVENLRSEVRIECVMMVLLLSVGIAAYWLNCWACSKVIQVSEDLGALKTLTLTSWFYQFKISSRFPSAVVTHSEH